eukprot:Protomagalhaensia_wolfi_Nauph_80__904@NODE_151_length_3407_cov_19_594121_g112_i0_p2_GENE_NODE_151_length_3407_cov_19_594121_g112_i0NODE_151_length_3407_cov_19_594121_g112_i0_p2_ORF_typecomplete_len197_score24_35Bap31/PF05529_12/1_2e07_NODE_151_length_3407_cov_19_594121_g112_i014021992
MTRNKNKKKFIMMLEVLVVPVVALGAIIALLSGIQFLQHLSSRLCGSKVSLGKTHLTVGQIFLGYSILRFACQTYLVNVAKWKLENHLENMAAGQALATPEMEDRLRARVWRSDRDFWITFSSLFLWTVFIRATQLVQRFQHQIAELKRGSPPSAPKAPTSTATTASIERSPAEGPKEMEIPPQVKGGKPSIRQRK